MSTITTSAEDTTPSARTRVSPAPSAYVFVYGASALAFLWLIRRGNMRSLLDS
jgi:hypothetical protein